MLSGALAFGRYFVNLRTPGGMDFSHRGFAGDGTDSTCSTGVARLAGVAAGRARLHTSLQFAKSSCCRSFSSRRWTGAQCSVARDARRDDADDARPVRQSARHGARSLSASIFARTNVIEPGARRGLQKIQSVFAAALSLQTQMSPTDLFRS